MQAVEQRFMSVQGDLVSELYRSHALWAVRFAYTLTGSREVAEDITQEAFLRGFDRLETLRNPSAFPGYLRTTILNLARAHFRRRRIEQLSLVRHVRLGRDPDVPPTDIGEREHLWHALQRLPYRQRAALVLRFYEDLSERAAAEALGTTVRAVKALVSRGTRTMQAELDR